VRRTYVFVINSMGTGGAERVLVNLLGAMSEERRSRTSVHVILLDREVEMRELPAFVEKHVLDSRGSLVRSIVGLRRELWRIKPDLAVSFLVRANVASSFVCWSLGVPSVLCERMHLSSHLAGRYGGLRLVAARALPRLAYRFATRAVGVSQGVTDDMIAHFGAYPRRTDTMVNPFDLAAIERDSKQLPELDLPNRFIIAAGRLEPAKAMDELIDAYLASGVEPALVILGEGSQRSELQARIDAAGSGGRIHLLGYARNPFAVMARAEAYVSASTNEGFPNAMVEAMALGLPVIATDCQSGPAEILAGVSRLGCREATFADHGVLVPEHNVEALSAAIRAVIGDPAKRADYADRARLRAEDFAMAPVAEKSWTLFDGIASGGPDQEPATSR
jgi:glycosyltransferase involved in cell wall biosynthesis